MKTLDDADEKEVVAMTEDAAIGMKKPHRTVFVKAWNELQKARMNAASQGVPPQHPHPSPNPGKQSEKKKTCTAA